MRRVGVIGLGDMGIGLAANLVEGGFATTGYDLRRSRLELLEAAGGAPAASAAEVGARSDSVFVMVLNGGQVREALLGPDGAARSMRPGGTVIVTATVLPEEVRSLELPLADLGIELLDSPVSGGQSGADGGILTLMTAGRKAVLEGNRGPLESISKDLFHVGEQIGQGQAVKAALQVLIGCTFAATFEALVLGAKAGIDGRTLFEVLSASSVGSPLFEHCARQVLGRRFKGTGSRIGTMHKDFGICMRLARQVGASMFTTGAAGELFQAGISRFPDEDNWAVAKVLEEIADVEVRW